VKEQIKQLKKALEEKRAAASERWAEFKQLQEKAIAENADLSTEDSEAFLKLEEAHKAYAIEAEAMKRLEDRYVEALTWSDGDDPVGAKGFDLADTERVEWEMKKLGITEAAGKRFTESEEFKAMAKLIADAPATAQFGQFLAPFKAMDRAELKTLLTGASRTSAGAFLLPDRQDGYVDIPRRPRAILDLITIGDTDSDVVEYVEMTSRTNNAAETPEAVDADKAAGAAPSSAPESAFAMDVVQTNVKEITHYIPSTKRALADVGQVRTIIDQELTEGLYERADYQLLNGDGTGENLRGLLNTAGILTQAKGADSIVDEAHKAITKVALQFYGVEAFVFHPSDWETIRLSKDANNNYQFGPPSQAGATTLWGVPVVTTPILAQGTGLVGAFRRAATMWVRDGVNIAATDSHSDWFVKKIVAVMASYRCAFAVQRPKAICEMNLTV
jgi:HK97 family phage major capsid protein